MDVMTECNKKSYFTFICFDLTQIFNGTVLRYNVFRSANVNRDKMF